MNVYDIQISVITKQYLEYLDLMQELNLDVASEFLVMAATLIHIKSKLLLPRPETAAGDPADEEDPRDALVRRLLEHQKFKAAAELLHDKETLRSAQWAGPTRASRRLPATTTSRRSRSISSACCRRSSRCSSARASGRRCCCRRSRSRSRPASSRCSSGCRKPKPAASKICSRTTPTRADMIVTFLAMLEMIRLKLIRVFQQGGAGAIRIYKRARPADAPHPIHDPEDEYKAHHPQEGRRAKK